MIDPIMQDLRAKLLEKERLTTKSVAIENSISRRVAASFLESLPFLDTSNEQCYEITRYILENIGGKIGTCLLVL